MEYVILVMCQRKLSEEDRLTYVVSAHKTFSSAYKECENLNKEHRFQDSIFYVELHEVKSD